MDWPVMLQMAAMTLALSSIYFAARKNLASPLLGIAALIPWTLITIVADLHLLHLFNLVVGLMHLRTFIFWKEDHNG